MLLLSICISAVFIVSTFYIRKWINNYIVLSKLPGPPRQGFLIGNVSYLQSKTDDIFANLRKCARNYYPLYKLYAVHKVSVHVVSPEDSELILSNPVHNQKGQMYNTLHSWLKDGLLTSFGSKWQTRRKLLTPAFHFNILQQFIDVFNEETEELVEFLKKESKEESRINVTHCLDQFTLKTITETAMGTKLQFRSKREIDYKQAVYAIGPIVVYKILHPWCMEILGNMFFSPWYRKEVTVVKTLHKFSKNVIAEREKNFKDVDLPKEELDIYKGKKRLAMLDLLLSAKINDGMIDDDGIHEEVDTFMFEGHDTTASALSFLLMLVACHPEVQDQILAEMRQVLGDIHRKPNYVELQNLKYMERCIKETLRLYPSVFIISRTLGEDLVTHQGYLLPKETFTVVHIYDIHRNPDIYPDPEKFDPDRFLPENCQNRHPFAYLPFSAGPRNCIGQKFAMLEMKATLCALLANFVLEPVDTQDSIVLIVDIILRAKDPIRVKFKARTV